MKRGRDKEMERGREGNMKRGREEDMKRGRYEEGQRWRDADFTLTFKHFFNLSKIVRTSVKVKNCNKTFK